MEKFEINQNVLCDYCEKVFENISRETCEGRRCEEIKEIYIEDMGLEVLNDSTFASIGMDSVIFELNRGDLTFKSIKITGISRDDSGRISFSSKNGFLVTTQPYDSKTIKDSLIYFVKKKDMKVEFESFMMRRIKEMVDTLSKM
jgi:hypothetical protein